MALWPQSASVMLRTCQRLILQHPSTEQSPWAKAHHLRKHSDTEEVILKSVRLFRDHLDHRP